MSPISPISGFRAIPPITLPGTGESASGASFGKLFQTAVERVESLREAGHAEVERFLNGESEEVHQVALAVERAELAFDLFLQTRNKVVQAYQEVMRMQL